MDRRSFLRDGFSALALAVATPAPATLRPNKLNRIRDALFASALAFGGLAATSAEAMGVAPTVQYHVAKSTIVMDQDSTFNGYINGNVLTVSGWSNATSETLREGMEIRNSSLSGTTRIIAPRDTGGTTGNGGNGTYYIDRTLASPLGSSGSQVVFTSPATQIASISDLMGRADLSVADRATRNGAGPTLMQDGYGRPFLRFQGATAASKWLRNTTFTGGDTHNVSWWLVGRVSDFEANTSTGASMAFTSMGTAEANNGVSGNSMSLGMINHMASAYGGYAHTAAGLNASTAGSPSETLKRMRTGSQMQVLGMMTATIDGLNGGTSGAVSKVSQVWLNENVIEGSWAPNGTTQRGTNMAGFSVGRNVAGNIQAYFDLYELVGFLQGEMTTVFSVARSRAAQIAKALTTNWAIPAITKNLVIMGDSRSVYGGAGMGGLSNPGNGYTIGTILGEPGRPWSLPPNVRITNLAKPGRGIAIAHLMLDYIPDSNTIAGYHSSPLHPGWLFGGGNDYVAFFMGVNDMGGNRFPTSDGGSDGVTYGRAPIASVALGDDIYNGAPYLQTLTVTNSASTNPSSVTNASPGLWPTPSTATAPEYVHRVISAGFASGQSIAQSPAGAPVFLRPELAAHTSVTVTQSISGYLDYVNRMLARGIKVLAAVEVGAGSDRTPQDARWQLGNHLRNDLINDTAAAYPGKVRVMDLNLVRSNGAWPFIYNGAPATGMVDAVHFNDFGKRVLVSGGDVLASGYGYNINQLLLL